LLLFYLCSWHLYLPHVEGPCEDEIRKQVRENFIDCNASFLCQHFAFVENHGKIFNVSACLLVEQVGGKKEKKKSKKPCCAKNLDSK
jgi:hypothetical protein